jgi:hypothetical protein
MGSITRTIDELLGLGPLNLEDAFAGEIQGVFDSRLHAVEYDVRPADPRVFVASKARAAKKKTKEETATLHDIDNAEDIRKEMERSGNHLRRPRN